MNNYKKYLFEKNKENIKNMKKIDNLEKKYILLFIYSGFGNKVFDLIIGIYLKINYGYTIYYVDTETIHTKKNDPNIIDIFPNLKKEVKFISPNEGDYIKYLLEYEKTTIQTDKLKNLSLELKKNQIILIPFKLYELVFQMYDSFTPEIKKLFEINQNLINPEILSYSKTSYATIHIRYGDKLHAGLKRNKYDDNKFIKYPIYTPEFYYEQIKIIKKLGLPIVILTDSYKTVKHFILEKYNLVSDSDIFMPDVPFIDSFYLLLYSKYFVMSHSTFSYLAYIFSKDYFKNKSRIYAFCTTDEFFTIYKPADLFIQKDWTIYNNKKYILNFNQELVKKMYEFNEKSKTN
jgi:hypothetical protein